MKFLSLFRSRSQNAEEKASHQVNCTFNYFRAEPVLRTPNYYHTHIIAHKECLIVVFSHFLIQKITLQ